ncbi:MAG TPA: ABC transporter ATP-binding protein [Trebonia sp.]|nr:ABC transporter ATP-binding protein [Trebonia sp.]
MRDISFSVRFLLGLSWRTDPRRLAVGGFLLLLGFLATPAMALTLRELVNAWVHKSGGQLDVLVAALTVALVAGLMLGHFGHLFYFELGELNEEQLNRELLRLLSGSRGLEEIERPDVAERIDLLRQDIIRMRQTVEAVLRLSCLVLQMALTSVILGFLQPLLLLLVPVAVVPVMLRRKAEHVLEAGRERAAPVSRETRHLRALSTTARAQQEIRLNGSGGYLIGRQVALQRQQAQILGRSQLCGEALGLAGQFVFGLGFAASLILVFSLQQRNQATIGDVVLVVSLASQVSTQVSLGLELLSSVHAAGAGYRRFAWLRAHIGTSTQLRPAEVQKLSSGISLENVSFSYPGAPVPALKGMTLSLPPGQVVAIVGENGAGKSTLIKLLNGLYRPASGRILIDGQDLAQVDAASWRARTSILYQDFAQFEFSLQHGVGVGWLPDVESAPAVIEAIGRAGATALLDRVGGDLGRLLGNAYGDGTNLSGGQWQSVGFARAAMRADPVLLCLDEPGHSLDALTEQQMIDAYQAYASAVAVRVGGTTIFVTHRMSTVRLADVIVVLDGGRVSEMGSHEDLIGRGGHYAELYHLQSSAYQ